jgi:hypothetical protein
VIGVVVALGSTRALTSLLFGVQAVDVLTFGTMVRSMIMVSLVPAMCRPVGLRACTRWSPCGETERGLLPRRRSGAILKP